MDTTLLTTAGLGFVLGLRHALDPDHLVAVSTLVSDRGGGRRTSLIGGFWGLGHAVTLLAGSAVVLALKLSVSDAVAGGLETIVAVMLVVAALVAMRALTALLSLPLDSLRRRFDALQRVVQLAAGLASAGLGLWMFAVHAAETLGRR